MDPTAWLEYGPLAALAALAVGGLLWQNRSLMKVLGNDLEHIKRKLDALPCVEPRCPRDVD